MFKPLRDTVIVQRQDAEEMSKGGIAIPEGAREKPLAATVVAVGTGNGYEGERRPLDVKVGDTVLIGRTRGHDIEVDDVVYTVIKEEEILAVVE